MSEITNAISATNPTTPSKIATSITRDTKTASSTNEKPITSSPATYHAMKIAVKAAATPSMRGQREKTVP